MKGISFDRSTHLQLSPGLWSTIGRSQTCPEAFLDTSGTAQVHGAFHAGASHAVHRQFYEVGASPEPKGQAGLERASYSALYERICPRFWLVW